MAETTRRFALPLLVAGQGQKDITHNEALMGLDALLYPVVEAMGELTPPAAPEPGQSWVVGSSATGAWQGRDGTLATWSVGGWRHHPPVDGMMVRLRSSGQLHRFWAGSFVAELPLATGAVTIPPPTGGAVVDVEARAAIAAILGRLVALGLADAT
jgi:hypothetical protein